MYLTINIIFSVVTNNPLESDKSSVEVQDFKKIIDHFKRNL